MAQNFDSIAKNYPGRTPYLPMFFKVLSLELGLSKDSQVLDIACGQGELGIGISPYVGKVVAIDESQAMIEEARKHKVENIEFRAAPIQDLSSADFKNTKAILVGRALRYLPRDETLKFFDEVLPQGAAVVACASSIPKTTAWREVFEKVRARHGFDAAAERFSEGAYFAGSPFKHSNTPVVRADISFTFDAILRNLLSHRSLSELSAPERGKLEADLAQALAPYRGENGEYAGYIQTAGVIFRKTPD